MYDQKDLKHFMILLLLEKKISKCWNLKFKPIKIIIVLKLNTDSLEDKYYEINKQTNLG